MAVTMLTGPRSGRGFVPNPADLLPSSYKDSFLGGGGNSPLPSYGSGTATGTIPGATGAVANTNYGNVAQITQLINEINQAAQQKANAGRIPGETGLETQSSANIGNALAGQVDPSTINLLGQQAAERGVSTGSPMGPSSNAAYLKALGLTSMDRMNTGQQWLSQAAARNPAAPVYGSQDRFLTAEQEQQAQLAREQMANNLRIAQMHYANQGRTGSGSGGGAATTPGISSSASNWAPIIKPDTASGWSFPPGYSTIPRPDGPPMGTPGGEPFPWGTEGASNQDVGSKVATESDLADLENWFYGGGG